MSPEQARGRWGEVDERSDIWSLGATLFTLASGRPVHEALNTTEALGLAMTAQARPLGDLTPKLDKDLSALVDRALRFKPGDRWPNAKAMFTALTGQEFVPGRYPCSSAELVQLLDALGEEPSAPDEDVSLKTTVGRTRHGRERVESKAKQCSLPPRPTSVLPRGVDVGRVALLRTRYWELYEIASAQILVLRRTPEPLESTMDLRRENVKVVSCLDEKHRGWGGVVDMRKAPPPRNDLGFEDAMQFLRQRLSAQLSRLSVLVSSAAGLLQVSRIDRVDGISTHVTQSEEDALRYAAG
jgi:serine/threonine protein kinase